MITIHPYENLGHADHGWLNARHHFSFGNYYNAKRMNFGTLRVINDDIIQAGRGFAKHPHQNMEIITFVRSGAITHEDSNGNRGRTKAGDVQVMSAGSGIYHSEHNHEDVNTTLFQIWIEPNITNVTPKWDSHTFPETASKALQLLVSGDGTAPLKIHQDAFIYAGKLEAGTSVNQTIKHQAYLLISEGEVTVNDVVLKKGDGAEIVQQKQLTITANSNTEILLLDVPNH